MFFVQFSSKFRFTRSDAQLDKMGMAAYIHNKISNGATGTEGGQATHPLNNVVPDADDGAATQELFKDAFNREREMFDERWKIQPGTLKKNDKSNSAWYYLQI